MRKKLIICAFMLGSANLLLAQQDTLMLEGITVKGMPYQQFAPGIKVETLGKETIDMYSNNNLGEVLTVSTLAYIRSYGNGMASTISFRGTNPNHTGVYWNGININSRSLGQSDFSLLPMACIDKVSIMYGPSSALFGSDALGGSVHINSQFNKVGEKTINMGYALRSFDMHQFNGEIAVSSEKAAFKFRGYFHESANDFSYEIPSSGQIVKQNNAAYDYHGLSTDVSWSPTSNQVMDFSAWYNTNVRELQPVIGNFTDDTDQQDENIRLTAAYTYTGERSTVKVRSALLNDYQLYDKASVVETQQIIQQAEFTSSLKQFTFNVGAKWNNITTHGNNFDGHQYEDRFDIFLMTFLDLGKLNAAFNVRQNIISGYTPALAPSLNLKYAFNNQVFLSGQFSRNYRLPTLNDRYWNPGGNIELNPEIGLNAELGIGLKRDNATIALTVYEMWVDDWIIWVPEANYFSPRNIREVNSRGIEIDFSLIKRWNTGRIKWQGGYAYNLAENTKAISNTDGTVGEQLPYTPKHNAYSSLLAQWHKTSMMCQVRYTGQRSTLGGFYLDGYTLLDIQLNHSLATNAGVFLLSAMVRNLTDEEYQTIINRAMPGRHYQLSVNYQLKWK